VEKFNAAVAALDRGDDAEAARLFRETAPASPDLVEAWNGLGLSLLRGRTNGGGRGLRRALALAPRYVPGLLTPGCCACRRGGPRRRPRWFSPGGGSRARSPAPRVNLAVALARSGRAAEAEETLLAARRRFPATPTCCNQLGTVYERTGNREKSAEAYAAFLASSGGSRPEPEARVRERLRSWGVGSRLDAGGSLP
jgi:Flp pilus assembly protein TadD